jgi:Nucleotidyl transferase AbiEii toxin, Type IV TA system
VSGTVNLTDVRRTAIIALFSDDTLSDLLVLKGGNALTLVYGLGTRASLDVDFSLNGDFPDSEDAKTRIFQALKTQFQKVDYTVFDEQFEPKPEVPGDDERWGGYVVAFKIIKADVYLRLGGELEAVRRNALVTGPLQKRTFRIELSPVPQVRPSVGLTWDH